MSLSARARSGAQVVLNVQFYESVPALVVGTALVIVQMYNEWALALCLT